MLLPALSKAKEKARIATCLSNLRQQAVANSLYCADNDERFFSYSSDPSGYADSYSHYGGKQGTARGFNSQDKAMNEYVGRSGLVDKKSEGVVRVFWCPSDNGVLAGGYQGPLQPSLWDIFGLSYIYNSDANDGDGQRGLHLKKVSQVRNPSKVILCGEDTLQTYFCGINPFEIAYWHEKNRLGYGAAAYVDGHTAFIHTSSTNYQTGATWTFVYDQP